MNVLRRRWVIPPTQSRATPPSRSAMFRFPLLIAIVVVTGSFASKVEAGCSLKRWDWQQHPMIIKLPCTKILEDTNRVPVKLINPPKKGRFSSKTINKLWVHYIEKTVRCGKTYGWTKSSTTWQLWKPVNSEVAMINLKLVQDFLQPCYVIPFAMFLA